MCGKRIVCLFFIACTMVVASAQSISEIKRDKDYIWGEGKGGTLTQADNEALNDLITQIRRVLSGRFCRLTPMPHYRIPNVLSSVTSPMPTFSDL